MIYRILYFTYSPNWVTAPPKWKKQDTNFCNLPFCQQLHQCLHEMNISRKIKKSPSGVDLDILILTGQWCCLIEVHIHPKALTHFSLILTGQWCCLIEVHIPKPWRISYVVPTIAWNTFLCTESTTVAAAHHCIIKMPQKSVRNSRSSSLGLWSEWVESQKVLELVSVMMNKNSVLGGISAINPSRVQLGATLSY